MKEQGGSAFSRWTRAGIGLQVGLAIVLAVGAAVLLIHFSELRYVRVDFSASGRNTLDETIAEIVEKLPEPVVVDVFFRGLEHPYDVVAHEAQQRTLDFLSVAHMSRRDKLSVNYHDPSDVESVQARQRELGVEGINMLVVSCGYRRATLQLFGDIASVDWGNPTEPGMLYLQQQGFVGVVDSRTWNRDPRAYEAAQIAFFGGEEAFGQALLKVASEGAPKVYFASGRGEPDPRGSLVTDVSKLASALERDGFQVETWDPSVDGAVPPDCEVLAVIGAKQPYQPHELDHMRAFADAGGRMIAAPDFDEIDRGVENGVSELLMGYGMIAEKGVVCQPIQSRLGQEGDGVVQCSLLQIGESGLSQSHKLTAPLVQRGRRVLYSYGHSFRRGGLGAGGVLLDLISSPPNAWLDLPNYDFRFDGTREKQGRYRLCMLATFTPRTPRENAAVREGRVLGIASSGFLTNGSFDTNRDFLLNAFNWMAERDYRVRVTPNEPGRTFLDVRRGSDAAVLGYVLWGGMPGACLFIGLFVAWRRRS